MTAEEWERGDATWTVVVLSKPLKIGTYRSTLGDPAPPRLASFLQGNTDCTPGFKQEQEDGKGNKNQQCERTEAVYTKIDRKTDHTFT